MSERVHPKSRRALWLHRFALALVLVNFLVFGLAKANLRQEPDEMDTGRYLNAALFVKEHGGALALPWLCVTGAYQEAVQQPLYHAALSIVAGREFGFFDRAKLVTLLIGAGVVAAVYLAARPLFGKGTALVAAILVSWSQAFLFHTTMVACEPLLMLWVVAAWASAGRGGGTRRAWPSAVGLGLAFLTKASALMLAPIFVVYEAWSAGKGSRLKRGLAWSAVFLAVASPVLVRNAVVYGAPFHNPHSRILWLDSWEDSYRLDIDSDPPSALTYLRCHSIGHIIARLWRGVRAVTHQLYYYGLGVFGTPRPWREPVGLIVLTLALGGMALDRRRARAVFSLAIVLTFVLAFGWYHAVAGGSRFILPVVPILGIYAAHTISEAIRGAFVGMRVRRLGPEALVGAVAILLTSAVFFTVTLRLESLRQNPFRTGRKASGFDALKAWLQERVHPDETYAHGPSHSYTFGWNSQPPLKAAPLPVVEGFDALNEWIESQGIRYVVIDYETAHRRRELLRGIVVPPRSREEAARIVRLPKGWRAVFGGARDRPFIVLRTRVERSATHEDPTPPEPVTDGGL